jgi:hypothetical protein
MAVNTKTLRSGKIVSSTPIKLNPDEKMKLSQFDELTDLEIWDSKSDESESEENSDAEFDTESEEEPVPRKTNRQVENTVWRLYNADTNAGNCFCCNAKILKSKNDYHYGHVYPKVPAKKPVNFKDIYMNVIPGDYTVDNIRPVCINCNIGNAKVEPQIEGMRQTHMYLYMIDNNMHGLKYLEEYQTKRWLYTPQRKEFISLCIKKLDQLTLSGDFLKSERDIIYKELQRDNFKRDKITYNIIKTFLFETFGQPNVSSSRLRKEKST